MAKGKGGFGSQDTHIKGVSLRTEPEKRVDILEKTINQLHKIGKTFAKYKAIFESGAEKQEKRRLKIIDVAKKHDGLRGMTSELDNFVLSVYPSERITYNPSVLKESVGDAVYAGIVREDLNIQITIPVGYKTPKGTVISQDILTKALHEALIKKLGFTEDDLAGVMETSIIPKVDEEKLNKLIEEEKVTLEDGAKDVKVTWNVKADKLKK